MLVPKERISVRELAKELGVNYITALGYIHDGKIRGIKIGGQWKVSMEEVQRFLAQGNHPDSEPQRDGLDDEDFTL